MVALDEQGALFRIEARGQEDREYGPGLAAQLVRVLLHADGMQIYDTEEVLLVRLAVYPAFDGAQVVAELGVAGRLNAAEYSPAAGLRRPCGVLPCRSRGLHYVLLQVCFCSFCE